MPAICNSHTPCVQISTSFTHTDLKNLACFCFEVISLSRSLSELLPKSHEQLRARIQYSVAKRATWWGTMALSLITRRTQASADSVMIKSAETRLRGRSTTLVGSSGLDGKHPGFSVYNFSIRTFITHL